MRKIQCPFCEECYTTDNGLYEHIEDEHEDDIPKDYSVSRYVYLIKTGKTEGSCIVCKKPTLWNESTKKYSRFCPDPKCKEKYRKMFEKRMVGKYGKTTLLNDPDQQRKMLEHRKISGKYEWSDGTIKTYTGTYELDFLKMMDTFLNFSSDDVMTPSPHTYYYMYENQKKFYIPDAYIPSLNLEIEIKDGGDNPNMHHKIVEVDKVKEKLKDDLMASIKDINYMKLVNKDYTDFFKYLADEKMKFLNSKNIVLSEIIKESMSFITEAATVEEKISTKLKVMNAPVTKSETINNILNTACQNGHNIYIATDWHLYKYDKVTNKIIRNPRTEDIVKTYNNTVSSDDIFIYLGDFVDDEFKDKNKLKKLLLQLNPGIKILCKGNNDEFDDDFYKSCGFIEVVYKFEWSNILFSHMPVENNYRLNIHGHIHGNKKYFIKYTNQVDAYQSNGIPVNAKELIRYQLKYKNTIKEIKESMSFITEATIPNEEILTEKKG